MPQIGGSLSQQLITTPLPYSGASPPYNSTGNSTVPTSGLVPTGAAGSSSAAASGCDFCDTVSGYWWLILAVVVVIIVLWVIG